MNNIAQEWILTNSCNFNCYYCRLLKTKTETNEKKLEDFIKKLDKNIEVYCLGGEPFLHPKIDFIISTLKKYKQPFVFQSNGSSKTFQIIKDKNLTDFNLQISIHATEKIYTKKDIFYIKTICKKNNINLRRIDVFYGSEIALDQYFLFKKHFGKIVWLSPIFNFKDKEYYKSLGENKDPCYWVKKFNMLRNKRKDIQFEDYIINGKQRSIIWQEQCENKFSTFGKPCPYLNYKIFNSDLNCYNCCISGKKITDTCQEQRCFWM